MPGEDESRVFTEVLREKATRGEDAVKALRELVQQVKQEATASEAYWQGDGSAAFRESLAVGLKRLEAAVDAIALYPRELVAYADKHEGVITQANALAAGVEDVVWSED